MPLYEYECKRCHHRFEELQNLSDPPIRRCPKCRKGTVEKQLSASGLRFKGSGFYITDYPRKSGTPPGKGSDAKEGGSKDAGAKESGTKESGAKESGAGAAGHKESGKGSSGSGGKSSGKD